MELTKAEEQILHYLWKLGEATVQDILSCMEETGRPSRTTVSTIIRILENKGIVGRKNYRKKTSIIITIKIQISRLRISVI